MFSPTRISLIRETWTILNNCKSLEEAKKQYKAKVLELVLGEEQKD